MEYALNTHRFLSIASLMSSLNQETTQPGNMSSEVDTKMVGGGTSRSANATQVLSTVNEAKFSWFHVKAILISGVGYVTIEFVKYIQFFVT